MYFDKKSIKLLKKLYRKKHLTYNEVTNITGCSDHERIIDECSSSLYRNHLIREHTVSGPNEYGECKYDGYDITIEGVAYWEAYKRRKYIFWVPYTITTIIALLSLFTTIVANWHIIQGWFA